jgi:hypothetical protein
MVWGTSKFFAFTGGQAVAAQTFIQPGLFDLLSDRLDRGLELARQLVDTAVRSCQFDDAPPILRRVRLMGPRHLGNLLLFSQHRLRNRVNSGSLGVGFE